jgi:tetratricopeptide (TPR) repeat protein
MRLEWLLCAALSAAAAPDPWEEAVRRGNEAFRDGRYVDAEKEYRAALEKAEDGPERSPERAATLSNIASVYQELGRYGEAERLYLRSIRMWEHLPGLAVGAAKPLNNLGTLYAQLRRYSEAVKAYERSLHLRSASTEQDVARVVHNLGRVHQLMGNHARAEEMYRKAMAALVAPMEIAAVLANMATLEAQQGKRESARQTLARALATAEAAAGADHPELVGFLLKTAVLEQQEKRHTAAAALLERASRIAETKLGSDHPITATVLVQYAESLRKIKRTAEARKLEQRAASVLRSYAASHTIDVTQLDPRVPAAFR